MTNLYLVQQYIEDDNPEAALEILEAALRHNPTDGDALKMLHVLEAGIAPDSQIQESLPPPDTQTRVVNPGYTWSIPSRVYMMNTGYTYWPDGGTTYIPSTTPAPRMNGLPALDARMRAFGTVEQFDQAELDARAQRERERIEGWARINQKAREDEIRRDVITIASFVIILMFVGFVLWVLTL